MGNQEVCQEYLEAFKSRDFSHVERLLSPHLRFRALIPGNNGTGELRTAESCSGAVKYLKGWFGDCDHFEVLASEVRPLGARYHISYRLRMHGADGWQLCEQRSFCDLDNGKIAGLDLLCSGFLKDPDAPAE
jgi:hypothetical protein